MRPFWLLAPKPPRKYPLTEVSPNFGFGDGGGARIGRGGAAQRLLAARLLSALRVLRWASASVGFSAKASSRHEAGRQHSRQPQYL